MRTGGFLARAAALGCVIAASLLLSACAPQAQRFEPTLAEVAPSPDATVAVAAVPTSLVTVAAKKTAPVPKPVVRGSASGSSGGSSGLSEAERIARARAAKKAAQAEAKRRAEQFLRELAARGY